jgi:transcriptional regulator with XRE-family HTH domain
MIEKFIEQLESKGWKQKDIAAKVGLAKNYISTLSHGANCSVETLLKFANAFKVTTDAVLGRTQEKTLSPVEELLFQTTEGNERIARVALRSAQGEKSLLKSEGESGKGRGGGSLAA